nr:MAG TPA: hypothetical protein [Caudoviricetes sp.]
MNSTLSHCLLTYYDYIIRKGSRIRCFSQINCRFCVRGGISLTIRHCIICCSTANVLHGYTAKSYWQCHGSCSFP